MATELLVVGTASSPAQVLTHLWPGHLRRHPEYPVRHQAHRGSEGELSKHRTHNLLHDGCNDREGRNLSTKGQGPKAFGSLRVLPKHFWAPHIIVKYDGNMNPNIWLEDYRLACKVSMVDGDLFII
jgi:hypothetical protein